MQIITIEQAEFAELKSAFVDAKSIGRYWKNGNVLLVRATERFMLIADEFNPLKIAIKPARSFSDAQVLAKDFLNREEKRGSKIELT